MTKQAWFVPKAYGVGYRPGSWQGWLATATFILVLVGGMMALQAYASIPSGPLRPIAMLTWAAVTLGIFFVIARRHTEVEMRWRW